MSTAGTKKKAATRPSHQKILWPLVSTAEPVPDLTEGQFIELEAAGRVSLTPEARQALNGIAYSWVTHDRSRHSSRPAQFRMRLRSIIEPLEAASASAELNGDKATTFERHMFHWLFMGELPGAHDAFVQLGFLPQLVEFFKRAEQALPADTGSVRPMDDGRFIQYLADVFEACGGKATAYLSAYSTEGYAKTPFRKFVNTFHRFLALKSPRMRSGLDEAIRRALLGRRRKKV